MRLAAVEYQRVADAVDRLGSHDWRRRTRLRAAKARRQAGQPFVDARTAVQVEQREAGASTSSAPSFGGSGHARPRGDVGHRPLMRRVKTLEPQLVNGARETWS